MERISSIVGHVAAEQRPEDTYEAKKADASGGGFKKPKEGALKGKTLFITGASRGIGLAIALAAAKDGANIIVAAKTAKPHPRLPGTIYTAAEEIERAGGKALPVICDIRFEDQVSAAVKKGVETFGGIDICVNNASAISITPTTATPMKRYDLMHQVNARGTFLVSQVCIPYLKKSENPHILNLGPPLNMDPKWFTNHVAYTMAKYGMSMCTLGMSGEFKRHRIAVNSLWPRTAIATAAVNMLGGDPMIKKSRTPDIMGHAAYNIFAQDSSQVTGNYFIDEDVMKAVGVSDLSHYQVDPSAKESDLFVDLFVE